MNKSQFTVHNPLRVLLTGSRGMLGGYIQRAFEEDGASVEITGLNRNASPGGIICDLTAGVPSLSERYDVVIHAAGTIEEEYAEQLNLNGTLNLIKALEAKPPKAFVFISDAEVYGATEGDMITEEHHTWTRNEVGRSKIKAEEALARW